MGIGPGEEDEESQGDVAVDTADPIVKEPPKYAVILHNDDYTTMEFVIEVLQRFFQKTHEEATRIMLSVHHQGKGVAGIYSFEIAETKVMQVTKHARQNGHPLMCTAEPVR